MSLWTVAPEVAGSIPVTHPTFAVDLAMFDRAIGSSDPAVESSGHRAIYRAIGLIVFWRTQIMSDASPCGWACARTLIHRLQPNSLRSKSNRTRWQPRAITPSMPSMSGG
jgi:hypothetical protein